MKTRMALLMLLVTVLSLSACGPSQVVAPTSTPAPTQVPASPTPSFPTYSEIVGTYPGDVELSCTDAEVSKLTPEGDWTFTGGLICPGQSQLTVETGGTFTTGELFFGNPWKSYGAKLTIVDTVTIDGKTYQPGAMLTVDKDLNWIQVSSWE